MQGKKIWICAARGGVGAGFITVNLGLGLCRAGGRVLLLDASPFGRSLDAPLSLDGQVVYDVADVCARRVPLSRAVLPSAHEGLFLLPGILAGTEMPAPAALLSLLQEAAGEYDFVLLDMPPLSSMLSYAGSFDLAAAVSSPDEATLLAAGRIGAAMRQGGCDCPYLLINRFSCLHPRESGQASAMRMVDTAHMRLLGLVPPVGEHDLRPLPHLTKVPCLTDKKPYRRDGARLAFDRIAARLTGADTPLLFGTPGIRMRRRTLLYEKY